MIDRDQVLHVANLARLELSEDEIDRMTTELSAVLEHIEKIGELDLEGVDPTTHVVDLVNVLRPDEPEPSLPVEVILAAAPEPVVISSGRDSADLAGSLTAIVISTGDDASGVAGGFGVPSPVAQ